VSARRSDCRTRVRVAPPGSRAATGAARSRPGSWLPRPTWTGEQRARTRRPRLAPRLRASSHRARARSVLGPRARSAYDPRKSSTLRSRARSTHGLRRRSVRRPALRATAVHDPQAKSVQGPRSRRAHRSDGALKEGEDAAGESRTGPWAASRPGTHPGVRCARPFPCDVGGRRRCDDAPAPWAPRCGRSWRSMQHGARRSRPGPALVRCPLSLQRATPAPPPRPPTPPPSGRAVAGVTPRPGRGATNAHQSGQLDPCCRSPGPTVSASWERAFRRA
jgi:hypothetical protein